MSTRIGLGAAGVGVVGLVAAIALGGSRRRRARAGVALVPDVVPEDLVVHRAVGVTLAPAAPGEPLPALFDGVVRAPVAGPGPDLDASGDGSGRLAGAPAPAPVGDLAGTVDAAAAVEPAAPPASDRTNGRAPADRSGRLPSNGSLTDPAPATTADDEELARLFARRSSVGGHHGSPPADAPLRLEWGVDQ